MSMSQGGVPAEKVMTLRISDEQHAALAWIAKLNGSSITEEIRVAIRSFIENRRRDPAFQERLRAHRAQQEALHKRLAL